MKVQFTNYITAVSQHIASGFSLSGAMAKLQPVYASATQKERDELRSEIVKLIAQRKQVKPIVLAKGTFKGQLGFNAHGTDRDEQARAMLKYYLPVVVEKSSTKPRVAKQVDKVVSRAKSIKSDFTKAEIKRLIALLSA